jgi:hypothetical protein
MAELSVSINGFLGTGATFAADLNLVVQLAMGRSDRRTDSRKAQATQSLRCMPNDGFAFQPVIDRIRDVAFVPATTGSPPPHNSPQQVLHDRNEPRCFGGQRPELMGLYIVLGGHEPRSSTLALQRLEVMAAKRTAALLRCFYRRLG